MGYGYEDKVNTKRDTARAKVAKAAEAMESLAARTKAAVLDDGLGIEVKRLQLTAMENQVAAVRALVEEHDKIT